MSPMLSCKVSTSSSVNWLMHPLPLIRFQACLCYGFNLLASAPEHCSLSKSRMVDSFIVGETTCSANGFVYVDEWGIMILFIAVAVYYTVIVHLLWCFFLFWQLNTWIIAGLIHEIIMNEFTKFTLFLPNIGCFRLIKKMMSRFCFASSMFEVDTKPADVDWSYCP